MDEVSRSGERSSRCDSIRFEISKLESDRFGGGDDGFFGSNRGFGDWRRREFDAVLGFLERERSIDLQKKRVRIYYIVEVLKGAQCARDKKLEKDVLL